MVVYGVIAVLLYYLTLGASIAFLKAPAITGIFPAVAIAVLAITAAAPISIASQACEGLPMPASTIMGRSISSIRICINFKKIFKFIFRLRDEIVLD